MNRLKRIEINGFKSIRELDIELNPINVLIGANGAGKSNFISFFRMLNHLMSSNLQEYIAVSGGANSILYYGAKMTNQLTSKLHFHTDSGENIYYMRLVSAANDTLIFADEAISFTKRNSATNAPLTSLGAGHKESLLHETIKGKAPNVTANVRTAQVMKNIMERWRVYHFHDTSATAKIKTQGYIYDNYYLRDDAGNLAAFLYMLRETKIEYYNRIVSVIQQIAPFFGDFILEPLRLGTNQIMLNWREKKNTSPVFGPHQLSDGTLRMMSLITLLLQPQLPNMVIIDEPELGLHPYAINILASLLRSASTKTQIIVSTQSVPLINQLSIEDLIVVDREDNQSVFRRLEREKFNEWLQEYTLGELWEKNVFGGRPSL